MDRKILIMKKTLIFFLLVAAFAASCEQDANVELPETEPELVLNCFISPQDSIIRVGVSLSAPVFGNGSNVQGQVVTNATVTLTGNSTSIVLPFNSNNEYYEIAASQFPIIAGSEYQLNVTDTEGRSAYANTSVPLLPPVGFTCTIRDTVEYSSPNFVNGRIKYRFTVNDFSGGTNYYRFAGYLQQLYLNTPDSVLINRATTMFSDQNADGETLSEKAETWYYTNVGIDSITAYEVWMLNCNYDYYTFHNSLYNNNGGGDPFSEPTLLYSNVEGGLGIFAASNAVKMRILR
jgi:hypothetical protein